MHVSPLSSLSPVGEKTRVPSSSFHKLDDDFELQNSQEEGLGSPLSSYSLVRVAWIFFF